MFHKMLGGDIIALDRFMIQCEIKAGGTIEQIVCQLIEDCNMLDDIEFNSSQIAIISSVMSFTLDMVEEIDGEDFEMIVGEDFTIIKFK